MTTQSQTGTRELDRRSNDGIEVALLWEPRTNRLFVAIEDARRGESFRIDVDPAHALDVFRHPYAYAPHADEAELAAQHV